MPAEPTKAKLKRKSSRKEIDEYRFDGSHGRELELKRNRGLCRLAVPNVEDKVRQADSVPIIEGVVQLFVPMVRCSSATFSVRGFIICVGSLATGQGTRFVLAATEHLHRRISRLSGRIRQLEDALAALHAKHSSEPHPLLHDDLIIPDEKEGEGDIGGDEGLGTTSQAADVLDSFGTLSISEHGISRFFGPTGGSESLLLANIDSKYDSPQGSHTPDSMRDSQSPLGPAGDLTLFSQSFPFTPMGQPTDVQKLVESYLPPYERSNALCETYFEQVSWLFHGVTRVQLMDDMLPVIYKQRVSPPGEDYGGPHDLALLFVILAIGALVGREPSNAYGEHFHQISRAALALQPVLEKPSIVTIQTLHLLSIFNAMSGSDLKSETSMEMTWSLVTLAAHLSQTIGLHRDSARWGLTTKMVERRRILFWDLFVADVWQSLNTGRPPSFSLAYIDCSFPEVEASKGGGFGSPFHVWQCRFAAECVAEVTSRTLTAEAPSYATIMELDRKVREFPLPEGISNSPDDLAASFERCVLEHIRETVLMYIHRSFFAQAIIEHPINPLKSAYAPSFLAAYRASSTILKSVKEQFSVWPNSCSRFWTMWTFAFSAAVVFGTVVTRGPRSPLAQPAMAELEQACILFSKASVYSIRAQKALPILIKLSEKARYALTSKTCDPLQNPEKGGILWGIKQEDTDDELNIIAGRTRFVSAQKSAEPSNGASQSAQGFEPSPPLYATVATQPASVTPDAIEIPAPPPVATASSHSSSLASAYASSSSDMSGSWSGPSSMTGDQYIPHQQTAMATEEHQYSSYSMGDRVEQPPQPDEASYSGWPSEAQSHPHRSQSIQARIIRPSDAASQYPTSSSSTLDAHARHPHYSQPYTSPQHAHAHAHQQQHLSAPPPQQTTHYMYDTQHTQPSQYPVHASHSAQSPPTNMELADLGLASRDSRLDERWSSFMADSGLLEDFRRR
ncbi:hypothetical protein CVT24_000166 [Panaeolus cyanescens]|uniref:Xylanolytic transcriptional activator regulatory domain-containing protein n=1 Tax=Panaeolus cyanescens TaxID=181874 RepID=A0A409W352_9AGAR|nr:hypothetical protein CVT24_000166 [Panaeolus cyanescens]